MPLHELFAQQGKGKWAVPPPSPPPPASPPPPPEQQLEVYEQQAGSAADSEVTYAAPATYAAPPTTAAGPRHPHAGEQVVQCAAPSQDTRQQETYADPKTHAPLGQTERTDLDEVLCGPPQLLPEEQVVQHDASQQVQRIQGARLQAINGAMDLAERLSGPVRETVLEVTAWALSRYMTSISNADPVALKDPDRTEP